MKIKQLLKRTVPDTYYFSTITNKENKSFIIGPGILLDEQGEIVWNNQDLLSYSINDGFYVKNLDCYIISPYQSKLDGDKSDRFVGLVCIDYKTGNILWNYSYESLKEIKKAINISTEHNKPDINLQNGFNSIVIEDCLYTEDFKVHIPTGEYQELSDEMKKLRQEKLDEENNTFSDKPELLFRSGWTLIFKHDKKNKRIGIT